MALLNNTILSLRLISRPLVGAVTQLSRNVSDKVTHTGQKWEENDYRLVRFTNAEKQVNTQWAVKLVAEFPPKEVTDSVVWCDGGSGPEGHPRVYINVNKPGNHSCGYCGLRFVKKDHHH